ncbi:ribosome maturation factor RimM [Paucilactobacillus suebicus]|uniref:Ribosome maturation factor RimM n=1 Tax=Paucilactobacillus suebicus DSM 5007 = KCTC 3549 TaxID=1423807 RepID=A0A0R1W6J6_9LACO|nr:ribosome maturation factor RimM [Paucilactobacillus suebicus]KRM13106.1 16S rRNA-processing protein RimM [Paucilactobacillus suebicus DSM 5007 = KCTC 3549]
MKYYNVGKIVNTHGIRGEVKVVSTTDFPDERFKVGNTLYIEDADPIKVTVKSARMQKNFFLVTFKEFNDINQIEKFKTHQLMVSEDDQQDLEDGKYYHHQIIGLGVQTLDGKKLGTIKEILSPGANDVWVVKRPKKSDLLLPVIDDVIKKVDLDNQTVFVELMEGLE